MLLAPYPSRSGLPTCVCNGKALHSVVDPLAEARRYVSSQEFGKRSTGLPSIVILIGPCLDYLSETILEQRPETEIISLQLSSAFRDFERGRSRFRWDPDCGASLDDFLLAALDRDTLAPCFVIEWNPAVLAFPREAEEARSAVRRTLARIASESATIRTMGRRWISNSIRNFLDADRLTFVSFGSRPVLVLAAGPTLAEALDVIGPYAASFSIVAVSSAAMAILDRGIRPDLVVSTDPGWWSLSHLRALGGTTVPIARPLSACPGWRSSPLVLIDQGWAFESALSRLLGPALRIPSHGTVSGSALAIAASLSSGPLIAAGFDFAATNTQSHVSPHAFDIPSLLAQSRLRPAEALRYSRLLENHPERLQTRGWRSSRALSIYAAAIASDASSLGGRLFRLSPSPVPLAGLRSIDGDGLFDLARGAHATRIQPTDRPLPSLDARRSALLRLIETWRREVATYRNSSLELPPSDAPITDLFRCIDLPDWAAIRRSARFGRDADGHRDRLLEEVDGFLESLAKKWAA